MWLGDGEGLLVNGTMIDRATGREILSPQPLTIGGSNGRARVALSPFRIVYEVPPVGNSERLIYRAVSLPRAEVLASLKSIRGEDWSPPSEAVEATPAPAAASTSPDPTTQAAAAAATRPKNPAMLKEWLVTVVSVSAPDGPSIERQLAAEHEKLRPLQSRHAAAEARADELAGAYRMVPDGFGGQRRQNTYHPREIGEARGAARKALEEVRDAKASIARLERELKAVATTRVITGTFDDGIPVTIYVDGTPLVTQVDPFTSGARIKVTGAPRFAGGTLEIKLRTVVPAE
jgi:hypothetical protein